MSNARRYILNINESIPSGFTTVTLTNTLNLVSGFTNPNTNNTFEPITLGELAALTESAYALRVNEFLEFAQVDTQQRIDELINGSTITRDLCNTLEV